MGSVITRVRMEPAGVQRVGALLDVRGKKKNHTFGVISVIRETKFSLLEADTVCLTAGHSAMGRSRAGKSQISPPSSKVWEHCI